MIKNVYIVLSLICFSFIFTQSADAYTFTRTLTIGSRGQDVLELQKFLNSNPLTQVSINGAGSPGNETNYFGINTALAVSKFQTLNASSILAPLGLTTGTGYFAKRTIVFINAHPDNSDSTDATNSTNPVAQTTTPVTTTQTTPEPAPGSVASQIPGYYNAANTPLFYPLVTASHPGKYIQRGRVRVFVDEQFMVGAGVKISQLDFYLGSRKMDKSCRDDYVCTLSIYRYTDPGTYKLKTSDPDLGFHEFRVVSRSVSYPKVSVGKIKLDEDVVIRGSGFTKKMKVYTPFGIYEVDAENNAFILNISTENLVLDSSIEGVFQVANNVGLKSAAQLTTYEK